VLNSATRYLTAGRRIANASASTAEMSRRTALRSLSRPSKNNRPPNQRSLLGKADCKVKFTLYSEAENRFGQKHVAYVIGSDRGKIHRHHCYRVRFNDNPNYPIFEILEALENCPGSAKSE